MSTDIVCLQPLVFPDGATSVRYGYDAPGEPDGGLAPENNAGRSAHTDVGYQSLGGLRLAVCCKSAGRAGCRAAGCGSDGGYIAFGYVGESDASSARRSASLHTSP